MEIICYTKLLFIVIISIILFWVIGQIYHYCLSYALNYDRKNILSFTLDSIFTNLFIGYLVLIFIYSICITNFKTINLLLLPIFIFYSKIYFSSKVTPYQKEYKINFLYILLFIISFFSFQYFSTFDNNNIIPRDIFMDFHMSARISYFLNQGFENTLVSKNLFLNSLLYDPYHYGELWGNALLSKLFSINPSICIITITQPILITILFTGVLSVHERINKNISIKTVLYLIIITLSYCKLPNVLFTKYFSIFSNYDINIILNPKYALTAIIILFAFLRYLNNTKYYIINLLVLIPIINSVSLLSTYFTIGIFYLLYFLKNQSDKIEIIKNLIFVIINGSIFILFYYLLSSDGNNELSNNVNLIDIIFSKLTIKRLFVPLLIGLFSIFYSPTIFHFLFKEFKKIKNLRQLSDINLFNISIIISSIISLIIFYQMIDARQLFQLPFVVYLYISSIVIAIIFINNKPLLMMNLCYCLLSIYFIYIESRKLGGEYSLEYREYVNEIFKDNETTILSLKDDNDISNLYRMNANLSFPGSYAVQINPKIFYVPYYNIELDSVKINSPDSVYKRELIDRNFESFYRKKFKITSDSQYINSFDIQYIFASKSVILPNNLDSNYSLVYTEKNTGEKLYKRNNL